MTRDEYLKQFKRAFALRSSDPGSAVSALRRLAKRLEAEPDCVGPFEAGEPLGVAASILSSQGRHLAAARAFQATADLHRASLRYHGYSLGSALAAAALELFEAKRNKAAVELAWEALRHFGQFPDPSGVHEQVMEHLRRHLNNEAQKKPGPR